MEREYRAHAARRDEMRRLMGPNHPDTLRYAKSARRLYRMLRSWSR